MVTIHNQRGYKTVGRQWSDAMADQETHACDCGATFDTLEELKEHAKENHPDADEENLGD